MTNVINKKKSEIQYGIIHDKFIELYNSSKENGELIMEENDFRINVFKKYS